MSSLQKISLYVFLLLSFPIAGFTQADGEDLAIGHYRVFRSDILNTNRTILVHLPAGYEDTDTEYPLVVKLFGTHPAYFNQISSMLDLLSSRGYIPPMILVGVDQHGHGEVIPPEVPAQRYPHTGDVFLEFVKKELIPFIENNYRTNNYRIMMGSYDCGIFGIYALFNDPGLFNAYLVNNPGRYGGSSEFLQMIKGKMGQQSFDKNYLNIAYMEDFSTDMVSTTKSFIDFLEEDLPDGLTLEYEEVKLGAGDALKAYYYFQGPILKLFRGYECPQDVQAEGYEALKDYYARLSDRIGYEVAIPYRTLDNTANTLWRNGNLEEAEMIFKAMTRQQPGRIDGWFRLGDICGSLKRYDEAIGYYKKCLEINPNIDVIKARIKELEEKK